MLLVRGRLQFSSHSTLWPKTILLLDWQATQYTSNWNPFVVFILMFYRWILSPLRLKEEEKALKSTYAAASCWTYSALRQFTTKRGTYTVISCYDIIYVIYWFFSLFQNRSVIGWTSILIGPKAFRCFGGFSSAVFRWKDAVIFGLAWLSLMVLCWVVSHFLAWLFPRTKRKNLTKGWLRSF